MPEPLAVWPDRLTAAKLYEWAHTNHIGGGFGNVPLCVFDTSRNEVVHIARVELSQTPDGRKLVILHSRKLEPVEPR